MAKDLSHFIQSEFGVTFKQVNIYRLLHQLGFSWIPLALATRNNRKLCKQPLKNFLMATIRDTQGMLHSIALMFGSR
ncbi:Uncharacterised protein [Shewanella morhuae]|uniref:Winged helix-turn helix domain-containing protein n=1 Tax=Shewanella morhuae TaxID=365591 RepID=A0A380BU56_9GAMM|nr:Uncharacterised protein [Shewanella morhuae]